MIIMHIIFDSELRAFAQGRGGNQTQRAALLKKHKL